MVHRTATADDKKLQFSLKKLGVNNISGIEEVQQVFTLGRTGVSAFRLGLVFPMQKLTEGLM